MAALKTVKDCSRCAGGGAAGRVFEEFIRFYTVDEMVLIITGIVMAIAGLFLVSLYRHWPPSRRRTVFAPFILALMLFVTGLSVKTKGERDAAVALQSGDAYFEPREDSTVHFKLPEGAGVKVLKAQGAWAKIERPDGKSGWVPSTALENI